MQTIKNNSEQISHLTCGMPAQEVTIEFIENLRCLPGFEVYVTPDPDAFPNDESDPRRVTCKSETLEVYSMKNEAGELMTYIYSPSLFADFREVLCDKENSAAHYFAKVLANMQIG